MNPAVKSRSIVAAENIKNDSRMIKDALTDKGLEDTLYIASLFVDIIEKATDTLKFIIAEE